MHPRNPFHPSQPDSSNLLNFQKLSLEYPELRPYITTTRMTEPEKGEEVNSKAQLDFKRAEATRTLTLCYLDKLFGLKLELLSDTLCPAVPNRLNYIHWVEDLLHFDQLDVIKDPSNFIRGLDIGTGASCIYPLLICRLHPTWKMIGTDINSDSITNAQKNIDTNNLQNNITLKKIEPIKDSNTASQTFADPTQFHIFQSTLFPSPENGDSLLCYDFVMCNPPFYDSLEEKNHPVQTKKRPPLGEFKGVTNEVATPGGEEAFLANMVRESIHYKHRVNWFTSMTGKKSTAVSILTLFKHFQISHFLTSKLIQGKTTRWVIGWTFNSDLYANHNPNCNTLKLSTKRSLEDDETSEYKLLNIKQPKINSQTINLPNPAKFTLDELKTHLETMNIPYTQNQLRLLGQVIHPTWTRNYRRQPINHPPIIPFSFQIAFKNSDTIIIHLNHPTKYDEPYFDSMCNHLRHQIMNKKS